MRYLRHPVLAFWIALFAVCTSVAVVGLGADQVATGEPAPASVTVWDLRARMTVLSQDALGDRTRARADARELAELARQQAGALRTTNADEAALWARAATSLEAFATASSRDALADAWSAVDALSLRR